MIIKNKISYGKQGNKFSKAGSKVKKYKNKKLNRYIFPFSQHYAQLITVNTYFLYDTINTCSPIKIEL